MDNLVEFQAIPVPADLPKVGSCEAYAVSFVVDDDTTREIALQEVQVYAGSFKRIEEQRVKIKKPIDEAAKAVQALFKPLLDDNEKAQKILRDKCKAYDKAQEAKQREEQAALDKAARETREALERQSITAAAEGNIEHAAALAQTAQVVTAPTVLSTAAKISGVSKAKVWTATVTDELELLKSLIERPEFIKAVLEIKQSGLVNLARTMAGNVPLRGVTFEQESDYRVRAA